MCFFFFFFQAEDGIRDAQESRGLGDVYKRQGHGRVSGPGTPPATRRRWRTRRPADTNDTHDASCAAVGNRVMSSPTSAMITLAVVTPTPGIGSRRATASAKGAICLSLIH